MNGLCWGLTAPAIHLNHFIQKEGINMKWEPIHHPDIMSGYYASTKGDVYHENSSNNIIKPEYHSTNGYDFILLCDNNRNPRLFPIDDIIAITYIPIPKSLMNKRVKVNHINGNTRDNDLGNLEWVEDIEEWKTCTYPGVKPDMYEVSSWGRVRNIQTEMIIKGCVNFQKYIQQTIKTTLENRKKIVLRHRLIAWEFCIRDIDFQTNQVNHIDGIKYHNHPKNLEIVSQHDNLKHAFDYDLNVRFESCERHMNTNLTNDDVEKICEAIVKYKGDIKRVMISTKELGINVNIGTVKDIKNKHAWNKISDRYFDKTDYTNTLLSKDDVIKIIHSLLNHKGEENIIDTVYHELKTIIPAITINRIHNIRYKTAWKELSDLYFSKGEI